MNNMPYQFMPDTNMMNIPYQYNKIMELDNRVSRLERQLQRIEHKVMTTNKNKLPLTSKDETDLDDIDGIYMM